MYSFPNFESVHFFMSVSNHCFLTCIQVSQRQVRWSGIHICLGILHSLLWSTKSKPFTESVKQMFFWEFPCFFYDSADVDNLISGSFDFSKSRLYIWKFLVHILLKPSLKDFEHYLTSTWNECNCTVVWTFFGITFLWDWNENWPFPVLWPWLSLPNLLTYWVQPSIWI